MTLEPTPPVPRAPIDLDKLRHHWVRPDIAAEALGFEEGTVLAWMGQKKVRSTWIGTRHLVQFDDLERFVARLPATQENHWKQDDMIVKQAGQVQAAITRLLNLLTDTSQADLFHMIPAYRNPVDGIDIRLWLIAQRAEAFRKRLQGSFYEKGYRIEVQEPPPEKEDEEQ